VSVAEHPGLAVPDELAYHSYGTGEKLPLDIPIFRPSGNPTEAYRIMSGFYCTGDSATLTLSSEQFRQFLQIQALGRISVGLLQMFNPQSAVGNQEELTPRQRLLRQILAIRDSIETEKGTLPESYPLIREDRER
jgi:hypothetical protein